MPPDASDGGGVHAGRECDGPARTSPYAQPGHHVRHGPDTTYARAGSRAPHTPAAAYVTIGAMEPAPDSFPTPFPFVLVLLRRMADFQPGMVEDALRELGFGR